MQLKQTVGVELLCCPFVMCVCVCINLFAVSGVIYFILSFLWNN